MMYNRYARSFHYLITGMDMFQYCYPDGVQGSDLLCWTLVLILLIVNKDSNHHEYFASSRDPLGLQIDAWCYTTHIIDSGCLCRYSSANIGNCVLAIKGKNYDCFHYDLGQRGANISCDDGVICVGFHLATFSLIFVCHYIYTVLYHSPLETTWILSVWCPACPISASIWFLIYQIKLGHSPLMFSRHVIFFRFGINK